MWAGALPQQGACKLTLNIKDGIIEEALIETHRLLGHDPLGCDGIGDPAGQDHSRGALNTDLVCDAINTAMRELFLQIVYGRTQSRFLRRTDLP